MFRERTGHDSFRHPECQPSQNVPRSLPASDSCATRLMLVVMLLPSLCGAVVGADTGAPALPSFGSPGYLPDHPGYAIDRMRERFDLALAGDGEPTLALSIRFAREKLAETEAMVRAGDAGHAWLAGGLYRDYLERAAAAIDDLPASGQATLRVQLANEVLDHIELLAVHYRFMPVDVRVFALKPLVNAGLLLIENQRTALGGAAAERIGTRLAALAGVTAGMWQADSARVHEAR